MQDENTKRLLELQMEELKATYALDTQEAAPEKTIDDEKAELAKKKKNEKDAALAKLYEDAAEYEEELESFENELAVVKANEIKDIPEALSKELPNEERDYSTELQAILIAHWTHLVEVQKTNELGELEIIKTSNFSDVVEKLTNSYPNYEGNFEIDIKNILIKRLETLIAIKKEHIEEEMDEIYIAGLKPSFVKRIYKQYHGIK
ncbi:hypothetical protein GJV85_10710 [Sulfurimonas aquatica]|uniref:Uncharacterized protein n=1 Tax=Sulfurimonas aquatica TaxID=2672570 RepID=A0A975B1K5_9BACT|nr:hypothetical protein [Sulfurimonas aquatica]QSZ42557.1 hypothetical protein GJV85_10710 [Sulfurimonas aquatica]